MRATRRNEWAAPAPVGVDVVSDTLSLETARDVLSTHHPESFHVNGYLTCAGCRRGVPWTVEHVMAYLQKAAVADAH